ENILDEIALRGDLTPEIMSTLAREIAGAHDRATVVRENGAANIERVLDINLAGFRQSRVFSDAQIERIDKAFRKTLKQKAPILEKRAARGCIKRCHGDLHLRNICLFEGRPQLFDCIDFNDQLATVDVLYDLAFLAMDLWHRGLRELASLVVNHYLDSCDQEDGYACLPFFIALRAAVRAHVLATQSEDAHIGNGEDKRRGARSYYDLALSLLEPQQARLVAIGGFSGSGKSTVAGKIAPLVGAAPGARLIESDRTRKAMFGVAPQTRLPDSAYAPEVSGKVYEAMTQRALALLKDGSPVVTDAVFDLAERRDAMEIAARATGVRFDGLWLQAAPDILKRRITTRRDAASDATTQVLDMQLSHDVSNLTWKKVRTSGSLEETLAETRRLLEV
ncbi:MAG: AAA family ATPase, partial [Roseobacter sp.]